MPVIDRAAVPVKTGSIYPSPYAEMMAGRSSLRLGDAGGLTQFGVNLVTLEPGALSSLRHWHQNEDEFVMVTEGALTLIDDTGETPLVGGDCVAFPAGDANGHHIVNRSAAPGAFLVVGSRARKETGHYSDVDMIVTVEDGAARYTRRDGSAIDPGFGQ